MERTRRGFQGLLSAVGWVLTGATGAAGQAAIAATTPAPVEVRRASSGVEVDGRLDEVAWREAVPIELRWEIEPGDNTPARLATDCRITFDETHLYFGCSGSDDRPDEIRAFLTDRDDTGGQDQIGIMIDPFRDQRRAFAFSVTPLGVQSDFVFDQGVGNYAWDAIWEAEGRRAGNGFTVEVAIPFKSLRFPATDGVQSWNLFFWRVWPRSQSVSFRSVPLDKSNQCALCQLGTATGFESIKPSRNVEITPTVTSQRTDVRADAGDAGFATGSIDNEYGLDARWSITSDLTLNATVNPDFSQVEADAVQLQSNQPFALFFQERRPFFLEGAEFYQTPLRAVFTRSIADPSFGTKVTGKMGEWALGALVARDETTNLLFPGSVGSRSAVRDQESTTVLGRIRRDLGGSHTLGGLITLREGEGYSNRLVGADARIQVLGPLHASAQVLRSETRYPADIVEAYDQPWGTFGGTAALGRLDFGTRDWVGSFVAESYDRDFRADAGFIPQGDQHGYNWRLQRKWWLDDTDGLTRFALLGGSGRRDDAAGEPLYRFVFADLNLQGALQSEVVLNPDYFERIFEGKRFYLSRLNVFGGIQPTARIESGWFMQFGEELDYTNARESGLIRLGPWIDFRVGGRTNLEFDYTYKRLTYSGSRVFREQVGEVKALYYFSRRAFFRVQAQLRDVVRDPTLYRVPVSTGETALATQLLFSYKLNPQSVLFMGYSDNSVDERENRDPSLGLVRLGRSFFFKLSYAWRP